MTDRCNTVERRCRASHLKTASPQEKTYTFNSSYNGSAYATYTGAAQFLNTNNSGFINLSGNFTHISNFVSGTDKIDFVLPTVDVSAVGGYVTSGTLVSTVWNGITGNGNAGNLYMMTGTFNGTNSFTYNTGGNSTFLAYSDATGAHKGIVLDGITNFNPATDLIND